MTNISEEQEEEFQFMVSEGFSLRPSDPTVPSLWWGWPSWLDPLFLACVEGGHHDWTHCSQHVLRPGIMTRRCGEKELLTAREAREKDKGDGTRCIFLGRLTIDLHSPARLSLPPTISKWCYSTIHPLWINCWMKSESWWSIYFPQAALWIPYSLGSKPLVTTSCSNQDTLHPKVIPDHPASDTSRSSTQNAHSSSCFLPIDLYFASAFTR